MFKTLCDTFPKDPDLPDRVHTNQVLTAVLNGLLYDGLQYSFQEEKTDTNEYIPLRKRRPSVRYALCRSVVDDSVALLFSDGHFPELECDDEAARDSIGAMVKETKLVETMIDAATRGSVGSVAILMRVLKGRTFFSVLQTTYLTPTWDEDAPDTLKAVTELYKTTGKALKTQGYPIDDKLLNEDFWFQRVWDSAEEVWFQPWPVRRQPKAGEPEVFTPQRDEKRTKKHGLGFVPMVWVKNLPGGDDIDGACTFSLAIDDQIEIDYQLSQAGRGLKYSSDPLLLIKEPATPDEKVVKGGGNALVVSEGGDAKLLEIGGTAATAVLEYVAKVRELALESIHGSRTSPDKISVAQSGRAMELMQQSLIWLADRLRTSYGEGALLALYKMFVRASNKFKLVTADDEPIAPMNPKAKLTLRWPDWYDPTYTDRQAEATTLQILTGAGLLSKKTAVKSLANDFDIEDVEAEITEIDGEREQLNSEATATTAANAEATAAAAAKYAPKQA